MSTSKPEIPDLLQWRPWPPPGDPFLTWITSVISEEVQPELIGVQLELQKSVLEAQLKAVTQIQAIVARK
jgi:hypothetical protein